MFNLLVGLLLQISILDTTYKIVTPKMVNVHFPAKNYRDTTKNYIVIHYDSSMEEKGTLKWLRKKRNSYHYFVLTNGTILKLVDPKYEAGHAGLSFWDGNWHMNRYGIGICLQNWPPNKFTEKQYSSTAWLISRLEKRFTDIPTHKLVGHADVAWPRGRKKDPGDQFDWEYLSDLLAFQRSISDSTYSPDLTTEYHNEPTNRKKSINRTSNSRIKSSSKKVSKSHR